MNKYHKTVAAAVGSLAQFGVMLATCTDPRLQTVSGVLGLLTTAGVYKLEK